MCEVSELRKGQYVWFYAKSIPHSEYLGVMLSDEGLCRIYAFITAAGTNWDFGLTYDLRQIPNWKFEVIGTGGESNEKEGAV